MAYNEYYSFRSSLLDSLKRDVLGPSAIDELISDPPTVRYISGILYPRQSGTVDPSQDIDVPDEDNDTLADPPVALANVKYPSSMGISFTVDGNAATEVTVAVCAARYLPEEQPEEADSTVTKDPTLRRAEETSPWRREPLLIEPYKLDITKPKAGLWVDVAPGLQLFCRVREGDAHGAVPVTVVLVNKQIAEQKRFSSDLLAFFQSEITITAPENSGGAFVERVGPSLISDDDDLRSYQLLYRHAREFAAGHGCSVHWQTAPGQDDRAVWIASTFMPDYSIRLADSNPAIDLRALEMLYLSQANQAEASDALEPLCVGYEEWIEERRAESQSLSPALREVAAGHLELCTQAVRRMHKGIHLLRADATAWEAFRLANTAMLQQRARIVWLRTGKLEAAPVETEEHKWRPFQLAFILLCLEGIARPECDDRNLADLLWFPTGGGKTEAYLGLIAFTVFLRRLRHKDGGGVTALMRYTLRLLTIQQFERAALLICCCEELRRKRPDLGKEPISLGLWVGQNSTPNDLEEARAALSNINRGIEVATANPIQLHTCPWCGTALDRRNYYIAADKSKLVITCRTTGCTFSAGLPVFVVDSDIYLNRPTLVIGTVDKFAGLAWREQAANLFNLAVPGRAAQPPPELIIQDELHLISGPLGTLVGLYETAVDMLCTRDGIRPKVIASTATIRRAAGQAKALFDRDIRQFPPPGIDARDSYFAVESPPEARGTRMYVGLMAPGTSHATLLVRTYAALLQSTSDLPVTEGADPNRVKDPYWTLVGYFNSLRVLGAALLQVQDDVDDRMSLLAASAGSKQRIIAEPIELTSRVPSSKIPAHLKQLSYKLGGNVRPDERPVDVVLATNMISVGVDVDRLGLMAVMGQPQSTSEYIQSTSRVGRTLPGLVAVLFNGARSRDRSHYESFVAYHSAIYRQVEATGATPFSARSRDRGLHAVLVALARQLYSDMRVNTDASSVSSHLDQLNALKERIIRRVEKIDEGEVYGTESQLDEIISAWTRRASEFSGLVYNDRRNPSKALLIDPSYAGPVQPEGFPTLWSLRDVGKGSNLYLINIE